MSKYLIFAMNLVVMGYVFARPQVFDYRASLKHMYVREVTVSTPNYTGRVFQKYFKRAYLKGYFILDADGVTSPTITAGRDAPSTATAFDHGRKRGFLVVQNFRAEAAFRTPKILPGVLCATWLDTQFTREHRAVSGLAEGSLFVGGDSVACVRTQLDVIDGIVTDRETSPVSPSCRTPGMSAHADYAWTSAYLFGRFNGPNGFRATIGISPGISPFDSFERAWDANLPPDLQTDWPNKPRVNYFHDTWMDASGGGSYTTISAETADESHGEGELVLARLDGSVKGGLFLCIENGIDAGSPACSWFDGLAWEDQFNCVRLDVAATFTPDAWQNDMRNDGAIEVETTNVIYGSWSIKWNRTFYSSESGMAYNLTPSEERLIGPAPNTRPLWTAIKGAVRKLNKNVPIYDGSEIYTRSKGLFGGGRQIEDEGTLFPVVTPQFATYYGLR